MKLADTNIWLALVLSKHRFHARARKWLSEQDGGEEIVFCRSTQQSLLRLLTSAALFRPFGIPPLTNREAWMVYEGLRGNDRIAFAEEPSGIEACWKTFVLRDTASPKVWMDAYLAAFAVAGGNQLVTTDSDFKEYEGLDLELLNNEQGSAVRL